MVGERVAGPIVHTILDMSLAGDGTRKYLPYFSRKRNCSCPSSPAPSHRDDSVHRVPEDSELVVAAASAAVEEDELLESLLLRGESSKVVEFFKSFIDVVEEEAPMTLSQGEIVVGITLFLKSCRDAEDEATTVLKLPIGEIPVGAIIGEDWCCERETEGLNLGLGTNAWVVSKLSQRKAVKVVAGIIVEHFIVLSFLCCLFLVMPNYICI